MAQVDAMGNRVGLRYLVGGGGVGGTGRVLVNQFTAVVCSNQLCTFPFPSTCKQLAQVKRHAAPDLFSSSAAFLL